MAKKTEKKEEKKEKKKKGTKKMAAKGIGKTILISGLVSTGIAALAGGIAWFLYRREQAPLGFFTQGDAGVRPARRQYLRAMQDSIQLAAQKASRGENVRGKKEDVLYKEEKDIFYAPKKAESEEKAVGGGK